LAGSSIEPTLVCVCARARHTHPPPIPPHSHTSTYTQARVSVSRFWMLVLWSVPAPQPPVRSDLPLIPGGVLSPFCPNYTSAWHPAIQAFLETAISGVHPSACKTIISAVYLTLSSWVRVHVVVVVSTFMFVTERLLVRISVQYCWSCIPQCRTKDYLVQLGAGSCSD
jgi:hypothetical protein